MASQSSNQSKSNSVEQDQSETVDEYFTEEVVDVICSADLSKMKSSLLEEVLNQKKQALLANPDISQLLTALQKQRQETRTKEQNDQSRNQDRWTSSENIPESNIHRQHCEDTQTREDLTPLPIDLSSSAETLGRSSSVDTTLDNKSRNIDSRTLSKQEVVNLSAGTGNVSSDNKPQSSHISVHPSVYVLNRQTGTGSKTQAKPP